jgi:hypothetical protein
MAAFADPTRPTAIYGHAQALTGKAIDEYFEGRAVGHQQPQRTDAESFGLGGGPIALSYTPSHWSRLRHN